MERDRVTADVAEDDIGDDVVVVDQPLLREPECGPEHLAEVREPDAGASMLQIAISRRTHDGTVSCTVSAFNWCTEQDRGSRSSRHRRNRAGCRNRKPAS